MEKALKLLLMYFVLLVSIIICGTFLYSIYLNVQNFIVGTEINLFNGKELLKSVIYVAYCALFLICPCLSYYRGRHVGGVSQTIVYVVLVLLTWAVLFPGMFFLEKLYTSKVGTEVIQEPLSGKYFRANGSKVYYFTRDFYTDPINFDDTTTVIIDTDGNGSVTVEKVRDTEDFELYSAAYPFKDVLIKNTFRQQKLPFTITFESVIQAGKNAFVSGWTNYLGYCTFGLLLASIYAVSGFFIWKLINSAFLIISTVLVFSFNSLMFTGFFNKFILKTETIGFVKFLNRIFDIPILVLINLVLSLIYIICGIITFAVRNHQKKTKGR